MSLPKPSSMQTSSFQVSQKPIYNKEENPEISNAVSGTAFVFSSSKPVDQFQAEKADMDSKRMRRVLSNRRSAQRSREKKSRYEAYLETRAQCLEDQLSRLELLEASYDIQKEAFLVEEKSLYDEIQQLQKEKFRRDAEIAKNSGEIIGLRELLLIRKEQCQERLFSCNIGQQEPVYNYALSNYYRNSYQGNGEGTSYIAPAPSQMQMPSVPNMHETNLNLPNNIDQTNIGKGTARPDPKP